VSRDLEFRRVLFRSNGTGPWTIDPALQFTETTNTVNTDCSTFYSDFDVTLLDFRMTVDPAAGDDDIIGFMLGWQPGDSANATARSEERRVGKGGRG